MRETGNRKSKKIDERNYNRVRKKEKKIQKKDRNKRR